MPRGGKRAGAGRKPGSTTKKTKEIADKAIESGLTPLEYLLSEMRDTTLEREKRLDAAKAAAPYVHPRLNAVDHTSGGDKVGLPSEVKFVAVDGGD